MLQMKEILRNEILNIRITSSEKNKISKRAEILNMSKKKLFKNDIAISGQETNLGKCDDEQYAGKESGNGQLYSENVRK